MRIWLALRIFFAVLTDARLTPRVRELLEPGSRADSAVETVPSVRPTPRTAPAEAVVRPAPLPRPARSEALTLLATLQREARLLDIVQEPLAAYSDAQIGAAARDVLKNCAHVFERLFALQPALAQEEGSVVDVPAGYDPLRYRIVGNVAGDPPFRGKLAHPGWLATRCELPVWSGSPQSANVIAPVEVELG